MLMNINYRRFVYILCYVIQNYYPYMYSKMRNQSLKTLYQPKTERQQAEDHQEKQRLPKVLPTIAENRQLQKMYTKQLGINIKKFENLSKKVDPELNQEQLLRNMFYILRNFGEVENNFKNLFIQLHIKIKDFLFIGDTQICQKYKIKEGMSYKKAIGMLDKQYLILFDKTSDKIKLLQEDLFQTQVKLNSNIQDLKIQIVGLKEEVQKYKKMANVQYIKSLQNRIQDLKETVSSQQQQYKVLAKKNEHITLQLQNIRDKLAQQQNTNAALTESIYDLQVLKDKTEIYLLNTRDRFDQLTNKLEGMKEVIQNVETQNQNLKGERLKLVNRAASSFEDLTPRPKYSEFYFVDNNTHFNPTNAIMKSLMENYPGDKNQLVQKYFLSKKNRKLMQIQAIRHQTVLQFKQSQRDINKII